jgi:hypothetical protein
MTMDEETKKIVSKKIEEARGHLALRGKYLFGQIISVVAMVGFYVISFVTKNQIFYMVGVGLLGLSFVFMFLGQSEWRKVTSLIKELEKIEDPSTFRW